MEWLPILLVILLLGAFLYWQLIIAEGAYLGSRIVTLLYDWSARAYDRVKGYQPQFERWFLGAPLAKALSTVPNPLVLDVATGTNRLARALLPEESFRGRVVGLDYSRRMLHQATEKTARWSDRIVYLWKDASHLPFPDDTFEAVACLEALEFMPDPQGVLREMVRVLRGGGILLTTNRIGKDAPLLPGRTYAKETFEELLASLGLEMIRTQVWQEDYDLVWAVKQGFLKIRVGRRLEDILRCPVCDEPLVPRDEVVVCANEHAYPIAEDEVIELE
jgi:ubiquinone/menaquinone biosynthesis C-methylase UbiE